MAKNRNKHYSKGNADGKRKHTEDESPNANKSWDKYKEVDKADETDEEESWSGRYLNNAENATIGRNLRKKKLNNSLMAKNRTKRYNKGNGGGKRKDTEDESSNANKSWDEYVEVDKADEVDGGE